MDTKEVLELCLLYNCQGVNIEKVESISHNGHIIVYISVPKESELEESSGGVDLAKKFKQAYLEAIDKDNPEIASEIIQFKCKLRDEVWTHEKGAQTLVKIMDELDMLGGYSDI